MLLFTTQHLWDAFLPLWCSAEIPKLHVLGGFGLFSASFSEAEELLESSVTPGRHFTGTLSRFLGPRYYLTSAKTLSTQTHELNQTPARL